MISFMDEGFPEEAFNLGFEVWNRIWTCRYGELGEELKCKIPK